MANRSIDLARLFKTSFRFYRQYASFVIGVMTTYFVLGMVPQVYLFIYSPAEPTTESQILSMIVLLVQLFLSLGFIKTMYYLVDGQPVDVKDMLSGGNAFFSYVVAYFMFFFAVIIGLLLLILPGIYLAIRLQFYPYYIIEHDDPSYMALQKSWYATESWELELFLFGICMLFLNFLGALFFGFGVILTYPITTMATALIYCGFKRDAERIPDKDYLTE